MSEKEKAYRRIREAREELPSTSQDQQAGERFELPTSQVEDILATAKEMSKKYGILLPPPFNPFDSLPKIPASHREENSDVLERLERLEKVEEQPKETPKPTRKCPNCNFENDELASFCQRCGESLEDPQGPQPGKEDWRHKRRNVSLEK